MAAYNPAEDYYARLGVDHFATQQEITSAYRALAKKWHPDRHPDKAAEVTPTFQLIAAAYETLYEKELRAVYDRKRNQYLATRTQYQAKQQTTRNKAQPPRQTNYTKPTPNNRTYGPQPPPRQSQPKPPRPTPTRPTSQYATDYTKSFHNPPPTPPRSEKAKEDKRGREHVFNAWQNMNGRRQANDGRSTSGSSPNTSNAGFGRTQSTYTPKKSGYNPSMPGRDEAPAPASGYNSYTRRDPFPPGMADKLRQEGAWGPLPKPKVSYTEREPSMRTPYTSTRGAQASMFSNEELRRSANERGSPSPRASSEFGGSASDGHRPESHWQRQSRGGNATRPFARDSSLDDSDEEDVPRRFSHSTASDHGASAFAGKGHANVGGFKSKSEENINFNFSNSTFSPSLWDGTFKGTPEHLFPQQSSTTPGKGRQSPTRGKPGRSRPASAYVHPPPFPAPGTSQPGSAKVSPQVPFSAETWQEKFNGPGWADLPEFGSQQRPTINPTSRKGVPGQGGVGRAPPQGTPIVDLTGEDHQNGSNKPGTGKPAYQPFVEEIPDEMDIDSTPASSVPKDSTETKTPRSKPISPEGPKQSSLNPGYAATSSPSTSEPLGAGLGSFGNLANVAPFAPQSNGGLGGLDDIKDALPFESRASNMNPRKSESVDVDLPPLPKPPQMPDKNYMTRKECDKFLRLTYPYFNQFKEVNDQLLSQMAARSAEFSHMNEGWLTNLGESSHGGGFESHLKAINELKVLSEHQAKLYAEHAQVLGQCELVRHEIRTINLEDAKNKPVLGKKYGVYGLGFTPSFRKYLVKHAEARQERREREAARKAAWKARRMERTGGSFDGSDSEEKQRRTKKPRSG